jgi:hypothetical protein
MNFFRLIQPLIDKVKAIESQTTHLKMGGLYRESRDFEIRFSQSIGEAVSLAENEANRLTHVMLSDVTKIFPVVLDRVTHPHAEFKDIGKIERKIYQSHIKQFDDEEMTVEHFISTEDRDRGGDRLLSSGMRINGKVVVLLSHGFSQSLGPEPIAKPVWIKAGEHDGKRGIIAKTKFYDGSHLTPPDNTGRRLYEKAKSGFMPNWSIGWLPIKWTDRRGPHSEEWRDISEWELLEYSPVGVPMNPDAQCLSHCGNCLHKSWFGSEGQKTAFKSLGLSGKIRDKETITHVVQETVAQMIHEEFSKLRRS